MLNTGQEHQALAKFIEDFRHNMHRHPELSNQEFETTARIKAVLESHQIRVLNLPLKTGLVAEIGGQKAGKRVVLRSDIDALPIEEKSGVEYTSENPGVMHACGHDFHTSAALGAAILLKEREETLAGTVRILFQAAEETGHGAPALIETGALDDAAVIFGIHNDPTLPVGIIGSKDGALTAGVDRFAITISGTGSHAARPHEGNDPIIIAGQIIGALQTLIARNVPSDHNAVVSVTQVHSGSTWNVIPDSAWLEGTVRSFNQDTRELIERRLRQVLKGIAGAFDTQIELDWQPGPPSVVNTAEWVDFALAQAAGSGFEARRVEASPIGEDFAFYQQKLPGAFLMIGSGGPFALHHPEFRVDDRALFPTAHYLAQLAVNALEHLSPQA
ncbi:MULTISPECIES: amidohydrolase [unclassified Rahnella]|uniref:amidohydrolase n=1 Tax=unclassified Rahnella TaxID=2635087 RepID=UPI001265F425|nr:MULTISPECIES: amidohydrolase [unclassified Rahnella]KAB8309067.1 amidohydrolase [Rouxiella chamberiensis]MBU9823083.1 amidohydrolase [Rahnella sp. BCC 1045]MQB55858.1 amidohydrolase [Rahnella sp. RcJ3]